MLPNGDRTPRWWDTASVTILADFLSNFAGTERYTVTISKALAACGAHVVVFIAQSPDDSTWIDHLVTHGITVYEPRSATDTSLWRTFNDHLAAAKPDLVLVNPLGDAFVQWLPTAPPGLPLPPIVGVEYSQPGPVSEHWYPASLPRLIHRVDAIIATSEASREGVTEHFGYSGPTYHVPHLIHPPKHVRSPSTPEHHLGIVARLSVEKGVDYAFGAIALLVREGIAAELSVYGAGADADRLEELATCLGVGPYIHFRGTFHPIDDLDRTLSRHATWLQPSLFESIPTTLLELAARRRLVIPSDVGGVSEVFDGLPNARELLVPPADTRALATKIRHVLEARSDYALLTQALQDRVLARHTAGAVLPRLLDVLRRHTRNGGSC